MALVLTALTMRAPITVMGPLLGRVAADLGELTVAALMVSLPLVAFAVVAPLFPAVMRRLGLSRSIQIALGLLSVGLLLRQFPDVIWLLGGTVVAGVGLAVLNVALPVVAKVRWPTRVGLVTGIYTSVTAVAAALAASSALLFADQLGWRGSMASTGAVVAFAAGLGALLAVTLTSGDDRRVSEFAVPRGLLLQPTMWWLSALMALQAGIYYALVSWLPTVLLQTGRSELDVSALQGLFIVVGVVSGPLAGMWLQSERALGALALVCTLPLVLALGGLSLIPVAAAVWVALAGLACGATFTLTLALFAVKSNNAAVTAVMSSTAQSIGYLAAAAFPPILGAFAAREGSFFLPLLVLGGVALVQSLIALGAVRAHQVGAAEVGG
jgi:CP family cyanate transporter-like MFS transporter